MVLLMMNSTARWSPRRLLRTLSRHPAVVAASGTVTIAVVLAVMFLWPGGAPITVPIVGIVSAFLIPTVVAIYLERRAPYVRTRHDIERVLGLPLLATCPPRRPR